MTVFSRPVRTDLFFGPNRDAQPIGLLVRDDSLLVLKSEARRLRTHAQVLTELVSRMDDLDAAEVIRAWRTYEQQSQAWANTYEKLDVSGLISPECDPASMAAELIGTDVDFEDAVDAIARWRTGVELAVAHRLAKLCLPNPLLMVNHHLRLIESTADLVEEQASSRALEHLSAAGYDHRNASVISATPFKRGVRLVFDFA